MFGFGKKKNQPKKQSHLDKILMGVVLGGAIGSVLGVGLAPKKGADTRKDIGKQANKLIKEAKDVVTETANKILPGKPPIHSTTITPKDTVTKRLPEE